MHCEWLIALTCDFLPCGDRICALKLNRGAEPVTSVNELFRELKSACSV